MKRQCPDIVLILLDSQRADFLTSYGYPQQISPNLSAFAEQATQFNRATAPAQWTIPSHASLFTGKHPWEHGMIELDRILPVNLPTLAERLADKGYYNASFSNNPLIGSFPNGLMRGFHEVHNYGGLLSTRSRAEPDRNIQAGHHARQNRGVRIKQNIRQRLLESQRLLSTPAVTAVWHQALKLRGVLKGNTFQSLQDATSLFFVRHTVSPDQPIFCFINLMGTHVPYDPPQWALQRYVPQWKQVHLQALRLQILNVRLYQHFGVLPVRLPPSFQSLLASLYAAEVASQDRFVGWFIQKLRQSGRLADMLLIITADHGEHLGEQDLLGHGFGVYQPLLHVPLIIHDPTDVLPHGMQVNTVVSTQHLYHTILSAAKIATPSEVAQSLLEYSSSSGEEGFSLTAATPPRNAVLRSMERHKGLLVRRGYQHTHTAVFQGNYKLILSGSDISELYDLDRDPKESVNLSKVKPHQVQKMLVGLQEIITNPTGQACSFPIEDDLLNQHLQALGY